MTQTMMPPTATTSAQPQYTITDDDKKRQREIVNAWKAYNGDFEEPLEVLPDQPNHNVLTNRCQPIVDRGVDFLFGKPVAISVEENAPQEAQDFLDSVWGINEARLPLLQDLGMNGGVAGQAFLRIIPGPNKTFRLVATDPSTVFAQTKPQDCETVLLYCIEYSSVESYNGKPTLVFYHEEMQRIDPDQDGGDPFQDMDAHWEIQHWTRVGERGNWVAAGDPIIWPYDFPPLFSNKNMPRPNSFWGMSDIPRSIIRMNESVNLSQSNSNRTLWLYGSPILYSNGVAESDLEVQPGRIIGLGSIEGKITAVSIASDLANGLAFAANLRSDMDEQSAVPAVALGRQSELPKGAVSGITLELLFMPLLQKTEKKRCLYGKLLIDVSKALLKLAGFSQDIEITLSWQYPLPHDDLLSVQAALAKQQLGVSNQTLISEMGYDPDEEADRGSSEAAQKLVNFSRGQGMPPASPPAMPADQQQPDQQPGQESSFIGRG